MSKTSKKLFGNDTETPEPIETGDLEALNEADQKEPAPAPARRESSDERQARLRAREYK